MAKTFSTINIVSQLLLLSGSQAFCKDEAKTILLPVEDCVNQGQSQKSQGAEPQIKISSIRKNDAILGGTKLMLRLISDIGVAGTKRGEFLAKTSADLAGFLGSNIPAGTLVTGSYMVIETEAGEREIRLKIWKMDLNTDQGKFPIAFDATFSNQDSEGDGKPNLVSIQEPGGRKRLVESLLIERPWKHKVTGSFQNNPLVEHFEKYKPDFVILKTQSLLKESEFSVMLYSNVYLPRSNREAWTGLSAVRFDPNTDPRFNSAQE